MYKAGIILRGLSLLVLPLLLGGCAGGGLLPVSSAQQDSGVGKVNAPGGDKARMVKVAVSYSPVNNRPTLHEPVVLEFRVENDLTQPITLDLGADRKENFQFAIRRPDGTTVELPQLRAEGLSRVGRLAVEPGQTYTQKVLLNEWYEFPAPGKYELSARLAKPIRVSEGAEVVEPDGFRTGLEVQPENDERLRQVAAGLAEQISGAHSYEEAAEAALTLGYVKDPVAVPYLEKALSAGHMVEPIVIAGLERIGGEEAVRALTAASASQDEETAELARAALERVKGRQAHEER